MSNVLVSDCILPWLTMDSLLHVSQTAALMDNLLLISRGMRCSTLEELRCRLANADRQSFSEALASHEAQVLLRCSRLCTKPELGPLVMAARGMAPNLLADVITASASLAWQPWELLTLIDSAVILPPPAHGLPIGFINADDVFNMSLAARSARARLLGQVSQDLIRQGHMERRTLWFAQASLVPEHQDMGRYIELLTTFDPSEDDELLCEEALRMARDWCHSHARFWAYWH